MPTTKEWTGSSAFLQVIRVEWTKASRGAEGSRARNAVPQGFPIPLEKFAGKNGGLCVEIQSWSERNSFRIPTHIDRKSLSLDSGFVWGGLSVSLQHGQPQGLRVQYMRDFSCGAPERWFLNAGSGTEGPGACPVNVRDGESVRISDNGRFSDNDRGDWWYQQLTINAAWFDSTPNPAIFIDRKPTHHLQALAALR